MSSPAASSGVHRAPDTARERRCAELTAGAEREDAPSRTAHLTHRAVPAPSRTCSPHAPAAPAAEPYAARRDPDGHESIDGWRILLQHHDIVTGEGIVAGNVIEERHHRAARQSARRAAPSRTTSSERNRPRLPRTDRAQRAGNAPGGSAVSVAEGTGTDAVLHRTGSCQRAEQHAVTHRPGPSTSEHRCGALASPPTSRPARRLRGNSRAGSRGLDGRLRKRPDRNARRGRPLSNAALKIVGGGPQFSAADPV